MVCRGVGTSESRWSKEDVLPVECEKMTASERERVETNGDPLLGVRAYRDSLCHFLP